MLWDSLYKEYNSIQTDENTDQNAPGAYPGKSFSQGSSGNYVKTIQFWLSIISTNFSSIPNLTPDGVFGAQTTASVKAFQSFFGLTVDGIVGKATWQKLSEVFADVCAELLPPNVRPGTYPGTPLKVGSKGTAVKEMQFYLYILSAYYTSIPTIAYDGILAQAQKTQLLLFKNYLI
ncbi:MAG: peptidoglycan-binding domain-containing protein [Oscillospiraceae bacterium]